MPRYATIAVLCFPALLLSAGLSGCAAPGTPENLSGDAAASETPPADFTLGFTVLSATNKRQVTSFPRESRPSRFVMEADWVLRTRVGPAIEHDTFPSETRQLSKVDVQGIWAELNRAGIMDPNHTASVGRAPTLADVKEVTWIITYTAHGVERTVVLTPATRESALPLLNRLCDLAWMP